MAKLSEGEKAFVDSLVARYSLRGLIKLSGEYHAYASRGNTIAKKVLPLIHIAIFEAGALLAPRWN